MRLPTISLMMLAGLAMAAPPVPKTIDFQGTLAPAIEVYQANEYTIQWTVRNNTPLNLTGYTPFCYWARTNTAGEVVTARCASSLTHTLLVPGRLSLPQTSTCRL